MNILEHYIKEIHAVDVIPCSDMDEGYYVLVDMTYECYGVKERREQTFSSLDEWEAIRALGYFMA